jgi:AcrR family transcriptional regulator
VRVKTESRRQAFITAAAEVFEEVGFDAASMSEISARVGGARGTLYNYFSSKEELLLEVILRLDLPVRDAVVASLRASKDIGEGLRGFGRSFLKWITSPESQTMLRIGIANGGHSDIGRVYYERGPRIGWAALMEYLEAAIEKGKLRREDPQLMMMQLKALFEAGLLELQLLGVVSRPSEEEIARRSAAAVDVFLRAYGVKKKAAKQAG